MIRKPALALYTVAMIIFNLFFEVAFPSAATRVAASSITPENIVNLTNIERQNYGLNPLKSDPMLSAAAQAKARNMLQVGYWDHFGPNGETPWQFISDSGYAYIYAGENLAKGFSTAEGIHQAWMASPKHKENIVNKNYYDIGVAVVNGNLLGEPTTLVVQMFGATLKGAQQNPQPQDVQPPTQDLAPNFVESEDGAIKSITIDSPVKGAIFNDGALPIKGSVNIPTKIYGRNYSVQLLEGDLLLSNLKTDIPTWEVSNPEGWVDGLHQVTARVTYGREVLDADVQFTIDTTAPQVLSNTISVEYVQDRGVVRVSFLPSESDVSALLTAGDKIFPMQKEDDGTLYVDLPPSQVDKGITVTISDTIGNFSDRDISDHVSLSSVLPSQRDIMTRLTEILSGFEPKARINLIFAFFIFTLLAIEVSYAIKQSRTGKAHHIFGFVMWGVLIIVGILTGASGTII